MLFHIIGIIASLIFITSEVIKYDASIEHLFNVIVDSLYKNDEIFIREIVSNSHDAIEKLISYKGDYKIKKDIYIIIDQKNGHLHVRDYGIGMCYDELKSSLGTIAKSNTLLARTEEGSLNNNLIGQFGIGFYSAFLVADKIVVISKCRHTGIEAIWESINYKSYNINNLTKPSGYFENEYAGTNVQIILKNQYAKNYTDFTNIKNIVLMYHKYTDKNIYLGNIDQNLKSYTLLSKAKPIWLSNSTNETEYSNLYKNEFNTTDNFLTYMRKEHKGSLSYTSIIFVPRKPIIDIYDTFGSNTREKSITNYVNIYINNILLSQSPSNILPSYLSFIRGIIAANTQKIKADRDDLLDKNFFNIVKKNLAFDIFTLLIDLSEKADKELKALISKEKEYTFNNLKAYISFWKYYSNFILSGCISEKNNELKNGIAKIYRSYTLKHTNSKFSLDWYIDNAIEDQENIYYLYIDDLNKVSDHPTLEIFRNSSIDVLLLTGIFDESCLTNINKYNQYSLINIAKDSLKLSDISFIIQHTNNKIPITIKELRNNLAADNINFSKLLDHMKIYYKIQRATEVKLTYRLINAPIFISSPEYGYSPSMNKIVQAQLGVNEDVSYVLKNSKIVEINPSHKIIQQLNNAINTNVLTTEINKVLDKLYEWSLITSGYDLERPELFISDVLVGIGNSVDALLKSTENINIEL